MLIALRVRTVTWGLIERAGVFLNGWKSHRLDFSCGEQVEMALTLSAILDGEDWGIEYWEITDH